jgi:uncharacterized protein YegL
MKNNWIALGLLGLVSALGLALTRAQPEPQQAYDNVVILLDASGSMKEKMPGSRTDKMTAAKTALKEVLKQLPANTRVGLLVFSAQGIKDEWVYPLGPRDDARLARAIDLPRPYGDTPLGRYLKIAADRLLQERARQFGYGGFRLLVVTDGEAQDRDLVDRYTPEVIARGVAVDVIGVAMNKRHTLATKVHSYRAANDSAALQRALAEVFAEVGGSATDVAGGDAFALLEGFPAEAAAATIQTLVAGVGNNAPIGGATNPPGTPADPGSSSNAPAPGVTPPSATPSPTALPQPPTSPPTAPPQPSSRPSWFFWVVAGLIVLSVFGRKRKRR